MTEQSQPSTTPSPTAGPASSSQSLVQVVNRQRMALGITGKTEAEPSLRNQFLARRSELSRVEESEMEAAAARVEARQRDYRRQMFRSNLFPASGVPKMHAENAGRFGSPEAWATARGIVRDAALNDRGCLLAVIGTRGAGKTQIAADAILAACDLGKPCLYVEAGIMFMQIRDGFGGSEMATFGKFVAPQVLVIDQLEETKGSEAEGRMLFHIVNRRYADMKATILVSNHNIEGLSRALGLSIMDRLCQTGEILTCDWPSFRSAAA